MLLQFEHWETRKNKDLRTMIQLFPIPAWIGYWGCFGATTNNKDEMNAQFNDLFGVSFERAAYVFLSRCCHGKDRNGLYAVERHFNARPKRIRLDGELRELQEQYIKDPVAHTYDNNDIVRIYTCCNCGQSGPREKWSWGYVAGLANSDYIRECPSCGARGGDIFDKVSGKATLKIKYGWSHGKPLVFPESDEYKEVFSVGRNLRKNTDPELFYLRGRANVFSR